MLPEDYKALRDEELISIYRESGAQEIVGELYERYMALTYGVCLKYLKDREESKDAVMQIFEKLMTLLKEHQVSQFKGWLYVTARNHCLMQLRGRKGKQFEEIHPGLMENDDLLHPGDGPELETKLQVMEQCLQTLGDEQQRCVRLFYIEQKCYKDISLETGYELNKVKSAIQNGKRNLKICMEKNGGS